MLGWEFFLLQSVTCETLYCTASIKLQLIQFQEIVVNFRNGKEKEMVWKQTTALEEEMDRGACGQAEVIEKSLKIDLNVCSLAHACM